MAKLKNELTWSVSRDRLFRDCRRAYYYQYYGSWGGWERDAAARTRKLYILKNIKSLTMWAGTIVHETIARSLNRYARNESEITTGALQAEARRRLRSGWREAVNREWLRQPKKTNLYELYYGDGKSLPREDTDRIKKRVYDCLEAYAESQLIQEICTVPYMNWKPVDKLDSFMFEGLKVWCAIDFAYEDPSGKLRILDWKTGREDREALQRQLACYALYAADKWFTPLENVRLYGVFLGDSGRVAEYCAKPEMIVSTKEKMLSSSAAMRELLVDVEANAAREEDFPCVEDERTCSRCNYREVCPATQPTK